MSLPTQLAKEVKGVLEKAFPTIKTELTGISYLAVQLDSDPVWEDERMVRIIYNIENGVKDDLSITQALLIRLLNKMIAEITKARLNGLISEDVIVKPPHNFDTDYCFMVTK